jgi:hypothetical protein
LADYTRDSKSLIPNADPVLPTDSRKSENACSCPAGHPNGKRRAINKRGAPLFLPRVSKLKPVCWEARHELQRHFCEAVTEYVRLGYNQAIRENRQYLGFLMILMQRLVTSSTRAIASALERRLEELQATDISMRGMKSRPRTASKRRTVRRNWTNFCPSDWQG